MCNSKRIAAALAAVLFIFTAILAARPADGNERTIIVTAHPHNDRMPFDPAKDLELLMLPKPTSFLDQLMEGGLPFGLSLSAELKAIPGADKALKGLAPILVAPKDKVRMALPYVLEWK